MKKLLSLLLCLCMTVAMFPAAVFASVTRVEDITSDVYIVRPIDSQYNPEIIDDQAEPVKTDTRVEPVKTDIQVEPERIDISAATDTIDPNDRTITLIVNNANAQTDVQLSFADVALIESDGNVTNIWGPNTAPRHIAGSKRAFDINLYPSTGADSFRLKPGTEYTLRFAVMPFEKDSDGNYSKESTQLLYNLFEIPFKTSGTAPAPPTIGNLSYDYGKGLLTWTGENVPTLDGNGYVFAQIYKTSAGSETFVRDSGRECMEINVHEYGLKVTRDGDLFSCNYKPVTLTEGSYKIVIELRGDFYPSPTASCILTLSKLGSDFGDTPHSPKDSGSVTTAPIDNDTVRTDRKPGDTVNNGSNGVIDIKPNGGPAGSQAGASSASGNAVNVTLSAKEVSAGAVVPLPVQKINVSANGENATVITINTGSSEPVKVEIPAVGVTPGTVAVIVNADGSEEIIKTSVPTENGIAAYISNGASVKLLDKGRTFEDVPADNWAAGAVSFGCARQFFSGTSDTMFTPGAPMTRAMMVTVLARFDGQDITGGSIWYEKAVNWAAARGISNNNDPNGNVTREELATMLWRYSGSPAVNGTLDSFSDAASVSDYAQEAMCWAVENGIISGFGDNQLGPQGNATRAQVAQILKNFIEK